jgi:hypothetical protein
MPARCSDEPAAGMPYDDCFGLARAQAMNSATVRISAGNAALAVKEYI